MKKRPSSLAAFLVAAACVSCSPTNRYIESASLKRLPHGFVPILRNDDEKAGLEIGAGFGFSSSGPLTGTSAETAHYKTEKDGFGIEKKILTERKFGRKGNFENRFPGFASHATMAFFTDSPLGLHAEGAFSRDEGRAYYSYDLGLSLTSAFPYFGFSFFLKAGMGSVGGTIRFAETIDPIATDTLPADIPLETFSFGDLRQTRMSGGVNVYVPANALKGLSPFLGITMEGYPLRVDEKKFDEIMFTGMSIYAGARYSLTSKVGLLGLAGASKFGVFADGILVSRLGFDYRVEW